MSDHSVLCQIIIYMNLESRRLTTKIYVFTPIIRYDNDK